jgi:hypothetical protein
LFFIALVKPEVRDRNSYCEMVFRGGFGVKTRHDHLSAIGAFLK